MYSKSAIASKTVYYMGKKIYIIAGEPSGDYIGAKLINALKKESSDIEVKGMGGRLMKESGVDSAIDINKIALIGFSQIISVIPRIFSAMKTVINEIKTFKPDVLVTIDFPGFNYRVVKKIRKLFGSRIKIINYVAPSVWAYKPERTHKIAALYDHQLVILPNEKKYFDELNFPTTFVGHPLLETEIKKFSKEELSKNHFFANDIKLVTFFPGSRLTELKYHIPLYRKVINHLLQYDKKIYFAVIVPPEIKKIAEEKFAGFPHILKITTDAKIRQELISISDAALVKSGTITAELMLYGLPMVVTYKGSKLDEMIAKRLVKNKVFALCNILLGEMIIPEMMLDKCNPRLIADELVNLLQNQSRREHQIEKYKEAISLLQPEVNLLPSDIAAGVIMEYASYTS